MTGTWPARLVASIPPLVTTAWRNPPPPAEHPRQTPLSQLSQVSQMSQSKLWRKQPRHRPLFHLSHLSQVTRVLHRLPPLHITHLPPLHSHPLPLTKVLSAPPPQKPPTHPSPRPLMTRPTTLQHHPSPLWKLMHVPSLRNLLSQSSQLSHPPPHLIVENRPCHAYITH